MAYKGLISRGEHNRGLTLRAKVVSPNKRFSKTRDYHVKIKSKAMTDMEKVVIALNAHRDRLENNENLNLRNIMVSLKDYCIKTDDFNYGTETTYSIGGDIREYFDEKTMKLKNRPKYGSTVSSSGVLRLTTKLNDASLSVSIPIAITPITPEDIFNVEDLFTEEAIWNRVKTSKNGNKENDGYYKVFSRIQTSNTIPETIADYIDDADLIQYTWTTEQSTDNVSLPIMESSNNHGYEYESRIDMSNANEEINIRLIPYPAVVDNYEEISYYSKGISRPSSRKVCEYFGGITLICKISIGVEDEDQIEHTFRYPLSLRSGLLTGSEILDDICDINGNGLLQIVSTGLSEDTYNNQLGQTDDNGNLESINKFTINTGNFDTYGNEECIELKIYTAGQRIFGPTPYVGGLKTETILYSKKYDMDVSAGSGAINIPESGKEQLAHVYKVSSDKITSSDAWIDSDDNVPYIQYHNELGNNYISFKVYPKKFTQEIKHAKQFKFSIKSQVAISGVSQTMSARDSDPGEASTAVYCIVTIADTSN